MKSSLFWLVVALSLPFGGCSGSESKGDGTNPLATVAGFCQAWAEAACSEEVVTYCGADDADACQLTQSDFCETLVPRESYNPKHAKDCIRAVELAYEDNDLTAEELVVVRQLGGPCTRLIQGSAEEGDDCSEDSDCDATAGFLCVTRPGKDGTCQKPVEVSAGRSCSDPAAVCEDGFYCDGRNCIERLPEDEPCVDSSECESDLRCEAQSSGEGGAGGKTPVGGTCVPRAPSLDACENNDDCKSGFCWMEDSSVGECYPALQLSPKEPICDDLR